MNYGKLIGDEIKRPNCLSYNKKLDGLVTIIQERQNKHHNYTLGLLKDYISQAITFSHTFRYINDLLCINNKDFELSISDIYPKELFLKKTNTSPIMCLS